MRGFTMNARTRIASAVLALAALAGGTPAAAGAAQAAVNDCAPASHNAGQTCGTWESDAHLFLAVKPGFGTVIVGSPTRNTGFNGTDFLITHVAGPGNPAIVEWAPGGNESGMFLTDVGGVARLVPGTPGLNGQWIYTGGCGPVTCDGPFQNAGTHRFLQTNGANNNVTTAGADSAANQNFTFQLKVS
jgi:hypothetical protein